MSPSLGATAEELRLELAMGLIQPEDAIGWADAMILQQSSLPGWVYDLSMATGKSVEDLQGMLREAPSNRDDLRAGAWAALDHLANLVAESVLGPFEATDALAQWAGSAEIDEAIKRDAIQLACIADEVRGGYCGPIDAVVDDLNAFLDRSLHQR